MRAARGGALLLALVGLGSVTRAADWADRIDLGATLEFTSAVELDGRFQSARLDFQPELELELPGELRLTAIGRLRSDVFDRLEPGRPSQDTRSSLSRRWFAGRHTELELRELYLEGAAGPLRFRIGKQQIVWGTADGLKVLDLVNPQSFRQFILEDFEDSRIPLWALNVELPAGPGSLQLVWLPDPTYHEFPEPGATFAFTTPRLAPRPPPGVPVALRDLDRPDRLLNDSDAGARWSVFWRGFDLSLDYLYHYHDVPIAFRRAPQRPGDPLRVEPGYERTHLAGGTLARAFGDWVLRAEIGYSTDRWLVTTDPHDGDGAVPTPELAYVVGLDWWGMRQGLVSVQLFQSWLFRHRPGLTRDRLDTNLSLLVRRTFWNETLTLDAIWIHNVNDADGLVRPRAHYELRDGLEIELRVDVFYGRSRGAFGQFDDRDRATLSLRWSL